MNLIDNIKVIASRILFTCKRKSPEILLGVGIATTTAALIGTGIASAKIGKATEQERTRIVELNELRKTESVSDEDAKKEKRELYRSIAFKCVKHYIIPVSLFGIGVASFCGSHHILKGREMAAVAAYTAVDSAYKRYKKEVENKFGKEAADEITEKLNKETAEKAKENPEAKKDPQNIADPYSFLLDCTNYGIWNTNGRVTYSVLKNVQDSFNTILKIQKYVLLIDVLEKLGFTRDTVGDARWKAAHVLGWRYDPEVDNRIDFGIFNNGGTPRNANSLALYKGIEQNVWLTFNVEGDIINSPEPLDKTLIGRRCA